MLDGIVDNIAWIFSGIGTLVISLYVAKKVSSSTTAKAATPAPSPENSHKEPDYKLTLGKRHKWLRENVLHLSLREMTEFYEFDSVTELEQYEQGEKELPLTSLKKAEKFFFLNPRFLELGEKPIFNYFSIFDDSAKKLFDEGFVPTIACCQSSKENLYAYIVMHKEENGFTRIVVSDVFGSFTSSGGGRRNIEVIIRELIKRNIPSYQISVLKASQSEWTALEKSEYYDTRLFHGMGAADFKCADIFHEWYKELANALA